jgi:hypothetical protein
MSHSFEFDLDPLGKVRINYASRIDFWKLIKRFETKNVPCVTIVSTAPGAPFCDYNNIVFDGLLPLLEYCVANPNDHLEDDYYDNFFCYFSVQDAKDPTYSSQYEQIIEYAKKNAIACKVAHSNRVQREKLFSEERSNRDQIDYNFSQNFRIFFAEAREISTREKNNAKTFSDRFWGYFGWD